MALPVLQIVDIIEVMENFIAKRRPPEHIRAKLDITYEIEKQSVIVYELRPKWNNPEDISKSGVAKATFVKTNNCWNVYWQRADLKWHSYSPEAKVSSLKTFVDIVDKDAHGCFWG